MGIIYYDLATQFLVSGDQNSHSVKNDVLLILCLFKGENPLTASVYMVAVDQMIVNDHLLSFTKALYLTFSLYYILNISYPVELGATLEFLQRYFIDCIPLVKKHTTII